MAGVPGRLGNGCLYQLPSVCWGKSPCPRQLKSLFWLKLSEAKPSWWESLTRCGGHGSRQGSRNLKLRTCRHELAVM